MSSESPPCGRHGSSRRAARREGHAVSLHAGVTQWWNVLDCRDGAGRSWEGAAGAGGLGVRAIGVPGGRDLTLGARTPDKGFHGRRVLLGGLCVPGAVAVPAAGSVFSSLPLPSKWAWSSGSVLPAGCLVWSSVAHEAGGRDCWACAVRLLPGAGDRVCQSSCVWEQYRGGSVRLGNGKVGHEVCRAPRPRAGSRKAGPVSLAMEGRWTLACPWVWLCRIS